MTRNFCIVLVNRVWCLLNSRFSFPTRFHKEIYAHIATCHITQCAAKTLIVRTRSQLLPSARIRGRYYDIIQNQLTFLDVDANHQYDKAS